MLDLSGTSSYAVFVNLCICAFVNAEDVCSKKEVANTSPFIDCSRRSVFSRRVGAGAFEYTRTCYIV